MGVHGDIDAIVFRLSEAGYVFEPAANAPWIEEIEDQFGYRLPVHFRSLVTRYTFAAIELKDIELFSNLGDRSYEDLSAAPFSDRHMSPWLIAHGFVQFARPSSGSYDPVCFDMRSDRSDPEIVRLDHEDILLGRCVASPTFVADSFMSVFGPAEQP